MSEFDRYSDDFDSQVGRSIAFSGLTESYFTECKAEHILNMIESAFGSLEGIRALDVGCGTGRIHALLKGKLGAITGADITRKCLDSAAKDNPEVRYRHYDGLHLPFDDGSHDVSFAINTFHHIPPGDWTAVAREMARVTRKGGVVAIFEHNPLNPLTRLSVARCEFDADAVLLGAGRVRGLLKAAGCVEVQSRYITFLPIKPRTAVALDRALSRLPAGAQHYGFGFVPGSAPGSLGAG